MKLTNTILDQLFNYYPTLAQECPDIQKFNSGYAYYFADTLKGSIGIRATSPLIYFDIGSSFPTLCRILLQHSHPEFIQEMDSISDKRKKLIFISTTTTKMDEGFLRELNAWSKIVIFCRVLNYVNNVQILEYKKDSLLCKGEPLSNPKIPELEVILKKEFRFHNDVMITDYYRFNKTSVYRNVNGKFEVKGTYKDAPKYLIDKFFPIISDPNPASLDEIKMIYSPKFYVYIKETGQNLDYFYKFKGGYMISSSNQLSQYHDISTPREMLYRIIFPILQLQMEEPCSS